MPIRVRGGVAGTIMFAGRPLRPAGDRRGRGPRPARRRRRRQRPPVPHARGDRPDAAGLAAAAGARRTSPGWRPPRSTGRPARATSVGGDFYDVFSTGDGEWFLVMGDVCGKGAEAAAVTALARYTIRAAAMQRRSPVRGPALAERGDAAPGHAPLRHHRLRPAGPRPRGLAATVACGGHPFPRVLRAGGRRRGARHRRDAARRAGRSQARGPHDPARPGRRADPLHRRPDRGRPRPPCGRPSSSTPSWQARGAG